ncbi:hypothetical protein HYT33_00610 [Candidatus Roizmanbacteria bacterium]|nr:hypothetical protein [Candidatus Roizmanbacteria bacterium]
MEKAPFGFLTLLLFGFILGLRHAFETDHIAAVSSMVSQTRSLKRASFFGIAWGLGHTFVLLVSGILVLAFKLTIPKQLANLSELLVGVVLVLVGIDALLGRKNNIHAHVDKRQTTLNIYKAFSIGVLHGLAGSAALIILISTAVGTLAAGVVFMLLFGTGSILGMVATSMMIAIPLRHTLKLSQINRALKIIVGGASILIGLGILFTFRASLLKF